MANTITLYYHHSRMLGMYRSGWFSKSTGDDNQNVYDDGPVEFNLPEGYTLADCASGKMEVYGAP